MIHGQYSRPDGLLCVGCEHCVIKKKRYACEFYSRFLPIGIDDKPIKLEICALHLGCRKVEYEILGEYTEMNYEELKEWLDKQPASSIFINCSDEELKTQKYLVRLNSYSWYFFYDQDSEEIQELNNLVYVDGVDLYDKKYLKKRD